MSDVDRGGKPPGTVDTTGAVCPMTFVLAKMALDEIGEGDEIIIRLNEGEALANVPRSIKDEGHRILRLTDNGDGTYNLLVRKGAPPEGPQ
ncbi:MAG: sulfurtransferase TusA family protein [Deltaproteobacteria bacterium]|jgi:TusA-related sulfurtransferase|nr:sulfurtransferase TusA family protein [Deltaproteobacteria bacterium]